MGLFKLGLLFVCSPHDINKSDGYLLNGGGWRLWGDGGGSGGEYFHFSSFFYCMFDFFLFSI